MSPEKLDLLGGMTTCVLPLQWAPAANERRTDRPIDCWKNNCLACWVAHSDRDPLPPHGASDESTEKNDSVRDRKAFKPKKSWNRSLRELSSIPLVSGRELRATKESSRKGSTFLKVIVKHSLDLVENSQSLETEWLECPWLEQRLCAALYEIWNIISKYDLKIIGEVLLHNSNTTKLTNTINCFAQVKVYLLSYKVCQTNSSKSINYSICIHAFDWMAL